MLKHNYKLIINNLKLYVLFFFILFYSYSYSQTPAFEVIKQSSFSGNNNTIFSTIYATKCDNEGYIYLATNKGVYYYNGKHIVGFDKNVNNTTEDVINLYQNKKGDIYTLPYYGKIHQIKSINTKQTILEFFNGDNYKAYHAFTDKNNNIIFQLEYFNNSFIGILDSNGKTNLISTNGDYKNIFLYKYFEDKLKNKDTIKILSNNYYKKTTQENRIIYDNYYVSENQLFEIKDNSIHRLFNGNKYKINNSIIIDVYKDTLNGVFMAIYGENKGLYYYRNNTIKTLYNKSNVNSITFDKQGNYYFTDLGNCLYKISNNKIEKIETTPLKSMIDNNHTNEIIINYNNESLTLYNTKTKQQQNTKYITNSNSILINSDSIPYYINERNIIDLSPTSKEYTIYNKDNRIFNLNLLNQFYKLKNSFVFIYKYRIEEFNFNSKSIKRFDSQFRINVARKINDSVVEVYTDKGTFQLNSSTQESTINKLSKNTLGDSIEIYNLIKVKDTIYYITSDGLYKNNINSSSEFKKKVLTIRFSEKEIINIQSYNEYILFIKQKSILILNTLQNKSFEYQLKILIENENIQNAIIKNKDLYISTNLSIYSISLTFLEKSKSIPQLLINSIYYNNKKLEYKKGQITLDFQKKQFAKN